MIALVAITYMLFIVIRTLAFGVDVPGYASLAAMLLFFSGMNLIGLGTIGEYLGRVFIEVKQRPTFLVSRAMGFDLPFEHWPPRLADGVIDGTRERDGVGPRAKC
jgi:hypothetical protein